MPAALRDPGQPRRLVSAHAVTDALVTHGIPVLANSSVPLERDGQAPLARRHRGCSGAAARPGHRSPRRQEPGAGTPHPAGTRARFRRLRCRAPDRPGSLRTYPRRPDSSPVPAAALLPEMGTTIRAGALQAGDGMQLYVNRGIGAVTCLSASAALPRSRSSPSNRPRRALKPAAAFGSPIGRVRTSYQSFVILLR
jgi:hypothetical protein